MISVDHPAPASPFVIVLQDPNPQGGDGQAPPVLRREDAPPPVTGGEGTVQGSEQGQDRGAAPSCFDTQTLPILIGFVAIFYFLILRPQQKTEKQRKAMLAAITKGERVVTNSGIHGEITALSDQTVTLRVDQSVQLTFDRAAIGRVLGGDDASSGDKASGLGPRGELLAATHLRGLGYRVVAVELRTRLGEIDLLVRRRRTWIAVEVKSRSDHPAPERCVSPDQIARVTRALRALAPTLRPRARALRVDVVAVRVPADRAPEIRHFPGEPFPWPPR